MSLVETDRNDSDVGLIEAAEVATGHRIDTSSKVTKHFKMIVRMADGSIRAIDEVTPANWRIGEQVILIAGTNPSK
jgi:alkyl hydroperoxide reductase subunit AhpC